MEKKKCLKCLKEVKAKDHQVRISTMNRPNGKKDDHQHFHFVCFVLWYNEAVEKKVRVEVERMRGMAVKLMDNPMIKGMLEKVGGEGMLQQMLGTPLIKPVKTDILIVTTKKRVAEKINNVRKKRDPEINKRDTKKTI